MVAYTHIKKFIPQKHIRASNLLCRFTSLTISKTTLPTNGGT